MSEIITISVQCSTNASVIWNALTNVEHQKKWYFDLQDFVLEKETIFTFYEPGDNKKFKHICTVVDVVPNKLFSHTWTYPELSEGSSLLTWQLKEENGITEVSITHKGIESFADGGPDFAIENFVAGWNEILHKDLKNYVENI